MRRPSALVLLAALAFPSAARAGDKDLCATSYLDAQRARRRGALLEAKDHVRTCLRECSDSAAPDCAAWLQELEANVPSVIIAVDRGGVDLPKARVKVDGKPVEDHGRAIDLDPGTHRVEIDADGEHASREVVVREAEKARRIVVSFEPRPTATETSPRPRAIPWPTYLFGGIGAVSALTFAGLGLYGLRQESDLERCSPRCSPDEVSTVRSTYLVGDVALGVSVVALGVAAAFYLLGAPPAPRPRALR